MNKLIYIIFFAFCFPLFAASPKIPTLDIQGVKGKIETNVKKRLHELQLQKPLEELNADELSTQISKSLEPFGYFNAEIHIQGISKKKISVLIYPGAPIHIISLNVVFTGEGAKNPAILKATQQNPLHVGDPLLTESYNKAKQDIMNTAENLGYLHGAFKKAEILIDETHHTAAITLLFDTGPLYYFGQVQFDPTNIHTKLLEKFIPFKTGQPYSTDQVLKFNNDLSNSGYFSSVLVKPQITDSLSVPLQIHLQPVPKYTYTLGGGYGTDTGVRGRAGLNITPVNPYGHKFNALAQGSFTQNAIQAQYVIPGNDPVTDQYSITGNFSNLKYSAGDGNALLVSLAQQHKLKTYKRVLSLNGLYEAFHYSSQSNNYQHMIYPKAAFSYNNTADALYSPTGYNATLNALGAGRLSLSTLNFLQGSLDAKAAYMIEPWRLRLYGHTIQGFTQTNNINKMPLSLALLLGGADNLKGYSFNSIGPGRIITYTGFELQKEIKKNWYLLGFFDAGDVYNPVPRALKYDAGAGLMWVSPIGPIKIGIAQPITQNLQRVEGSSPRFVVSMGPDL